jgi:hypothetical protein
MFADIRESFALSWVAPYVPVRAGVRRRGAITRAALYRRFVTVE